MVTTGGSRSYSHVQMAWKAMGSVVGRFIGLVIIRSKPLSVLKSGELVERRAWWTSKRVGAVGGPT